MFRNIAAVSLLLLTAVSQVMAQALPDDNVPVKLTVKQAASFPDCVKALAVQGKVCIVAEATPLKPTLTAKQAEPLIAPMPLSEAITKAAEAFDYDAQRTGSVWTWRKRYTDKQDIPSISLDEAKACVADVQRMFAPYLPDSGKVRFADKGTVLRLAASLSLEQTEAMKEGKLAIASLQPEQSALVLRQAKMFFGGIVQGDLNGMTYDIQGFEAATVCTGLFTDRPSVAARPVVGYEWIQPPSALFGPGGDKRFLALEEMKFQQTSGTSSPNPTLKAVLTDEGETLGQVGGRLAAKETTLHIEKTVAEKAVTVAGEDNAAGLDILKGMALIYGLRVRTETNGDRFLSRPSYRVPLNIVAIADGLRSALPEPLLRLRLGNRRMIDLQGQAKALWAEFDKVQKAEKSQPDEKSLHANQVQQSNLMGQIIKIEKEVSPLEMEDCGAYVNRAAEAKRRLKTSFTARLKANPALRLPTKQLRPAERCWFAVMVLSAFVGSNTERTKKIPDYVARFNEAYIKGGYGKDARGKPNYDMQIGFPDAQGVFQGQTGMTIFNLDKG